MKIFGKFWEVADFKDLGANGKVCFWGIFRLIKTKNALFFMVFVECEF